MTLKEAPKAKDTPLRAEMGDKKYFKMIEKQNQHYDKYKAGRRDPKTGMYYHEISGTDPNKSIVSTSASCVSHTIGEVPCIKCGELITVGSNSARKCCLYCGELNSFSSELKDRLISELDDEQ